MTRIAELEAEIQSLKDRRAAVEAEADRAHDFDIIDAAMQASDDLSDEIGRLRRELDEIQDIVSMRERARDQAYGQWATR